MAINEKYGMMGVGLYLVANAVLSFIAFWYSKETKDVDLIEK